MQLRISRFLTRHPNLLTLWVRKQSHASLLTGLYEHYKQNNMEEECLKIIRLSPVAWQHINLIGIYEFYNDQECLNLHELIEKLVNNKKIDLLAAA